MNRKRMSDRIQRLASSAGDELVSPHHRAAARTRGKRLSKSGREMWFAWLLIATMGS
ncbi:MAG TPA: hypothetical protein VH079_17120 [Terriglobales bacterium]|nr:hypothetical protein [Terriglobales bacterium]